MNENNNVTSLESLKNRVEISLGFLALMGISMKIFTYIFDYIYSIDANDFYGIPREYFFRNPLGLRDSFFLISMGLISIGILSIFPYFMSKDTKNNCFTIIAFSFAFSILSTNIFLWFLQDIGYFTEVSSPPNWAIFAITVVISILYILYFCAQNEPGTQNEPGKILIKCLKECFKSLFSNNASGENTPKKIIVINIILFVIHTVIVAVVFVIPSFPWYHPPQDKTEYEIVTIKNSEEKFAVISTLDDKFVLMDCTTKDGILSLEKGHYSLENKENCIIEYRTFTKIICE